MRVVQLLQDLIHYGVGQVGDHGELHLAVGTDGAVQLLPASPLGLHPCFPRCLSVEQPAGLPAEHTVAIGSTLGPVHPYLQTRVVCAGRRQ